MARQSQAPVASGSGPVASWRLTGGYSLAGVLTLRPPRLVVYPDGQTIADAAYRIDLSTDEVSQLVGNLVTDLRDPAASRRGTFSASAEGLDELRETRGYSDQVYDARDRLDALHRRIVVAGQPYTAARIRVVAEPVAPDGPAASGAATGGAASGGATPSAGGPAVAARAEGARQGRAGRYPARRPRWATGAGRRPTPGPRPRPQRCVADVPHR